MTDKLGATLEPLISQIRELVQDHGGRFDQYQNIPAAIFREFPQLGRLNYRPNQIGLDQARYNWLRRHFITQGSSVIDIGGNIGFFSLSLAIETGAKATLFEPVSALSEVCRMLAKIAGLDYFDAYDQAIGLGDVAGLQLSDLVIHLNVMHHAGSVFDGPYVAELGGWKNYAREYLDALSQRTQHLFFQTGNVGNGTAHFSGAETLTFLRDLLQDAGWSIQKVGVIENFDEFEYTTYGPENLDDAPVITCWRNEATKLVDYTLNGVVVASLSKGIAQRPLWLAKSRNFA